MKQITLATLHEFTAQQVFDYIVDHIRKQGKKASRTTPMRGAICAYRGEGDTKCAAGCLIADDEYKEHLMEGVSWLSPIFPEAHRELIGVMQKVHDVDSPEEGQGFGLTWEEGFRRTAITFNLTYTPPC